MAFPKILLAVPLVVAGICVPALNSLSAPPAGVIGMTHDDYARETVTVRQGQTLTFENNSRFIHIIGAGTGGLLAPPGREPVDARRLLAQGQTYTTGRWNTPGVYHMTCSVHPDMTIKIVVTPS